ncbi:MAG: hypothetical protein RLZZ221_515 [Verrucomicrobiota bacterium]
MSKLDLYKQRAASAVMKQRETVRGVVTSGEIILGATAGGYVAAQFPTIAGVPTDAGVGIACLAAGLAMKQRDLTAVGLGMLAGYAHDMGAQLAQSYPVPGR